MQIYTKEQIEKAIDIPYLIAEMEKGLILYSKEKAIISPSSFLHFESPPGDVHIKSGAIIGEDLYVVKIASGFYDNPKLGLPSSNGLMLLFSQKTGELKAIFLDEGRLTDLRTGLAGAIAAKHLANHPIIKIGIVGTGTQAREQLFSLQFVTECREVLIWGRNPHKAMDLAQDSRLSMFNIAIAKDLEEVTENCNLIVTATASTKPLLFGNQLKPGTHVTAVGTDDYGKQELDTSVFDKADLILADCLSQCGQYGDLAHAKDVRNTPIELGAFLDKRQMRQKNWITVADLTGIAIEDLQIAKAVFSKMGH
jgi:ornithine cyclodeaminase